MNTNRIRRIRVLVVVATAWELAVHGIAQAQRQTEQTPVPIQDPPGTGFAPAIMPPASKTPLPTITRSAEPIDTSPSPPSPYAPRYENTRTHRSIAIVAVRDHPESTVDAFLRSDLNLPNGVETTFLGRRAWELVGDGASDEDVSRTSSIVLDHFYDPVEDRGLIRNSLSTAWNSWRANAPGQPDPLCWRDARKAYFEWMTTGRPGDREAAGRKVFLALGHVAHLLQDAAQPQHTRLDLHDERDTLERSHFEVYCGSEFGDPGALKPPNLPFEPVPRFGALFRHPPAGIPSEFASFWDTDQYHGDPITSFIEPLGMAEYSSFFFVTDDTMFLPGGQTWLKNQDGKQWLVTLDDDSVPDPGTFPYQVPVFFPRLEDTNIADVLQSDQNFNAVTLHRYGQNIPTGRDTVPLRFQFGGLVIDNFCLVTSNGTGPHGPTYDGIGLDARCYDAHARKLLPKAVSYSTGVFNYFFRGKLAVDQAWGGSQNVLTITNRSTERFGPGRWDLYQDDIAGNRTQVSGAQFYYHDDSFEPEAHFEATYPETLCGGGGPMYLVFRGTIGNEEDAIAAVVFVPPSETWLGTVTLRPFENCVGCVANARVIFDRSQPGVRGQVSYFQNCIVGSSFYSTGSCDGTNFDMYNIRGRLSGATLEGGESYMWYCTSRPPGPPWYTWPLTLRRVN